MTESATLPAPLQANPLRSQMAVLRAAFPELEAAACSHVPARPGEQQVVVPNIWSRDRALTGSYGQLCRRVLNLIEQQRNLQIANYRSDQILTQRLSTIESAERAMKWLPLGQGAERIVCIRLPIANAYPSCSADEAVSQMRATNEFGLCLFTVSILLLTHPAWASSNTDVGLICTGSTLERDRPDRRLDVPAFGFREGRLCLGSFPRRYQLNGYQPMYGYVSEE